VSTFIATVEHFSKLPAFMRLLGIKVIHIKRNRAIQLGKKRTTDTAVPSPVVIWHIQPVKVLIRYVVVGHCILNK